MSNPTKTIAVTSAAEMEMIAETLSLWVRPGQLIALHGDLGSGKTTFARALIRALAKNRNLDVPSPTFAIVQTYDETRVPTAHIDLYRIESADELGGLGLDELLRDHVLVVEWPKLMTQAMVFENTLDVHIAGEGDNRTISLNTSGSWTTSLARDQLIKQFVKSFTMLEHTRLFLEGDASHRRYEIVESPTFRHVLMDMPARPDGPPVRAGLPYSKIAHLAEDIRAVVAVNKHLGALGYSVPVTHHADLGQGLALIELLEGPIYGDMYRRGDDMLYPLKAAVEVLADMATKSWPRHIQIYADQTYTLPDFDTDAYLIEVDLLPAWFWAQQHNASTSPALHLSFESVWRDLLPLLDETSKIWTLRDFHSPNLIWMPNRNGLKRVGMIDTQDAVMGHAAYDLVSLLQDARVDVPAHIQQELYQHYVNLRRGQSDFDAERLARDFAILGAQRSSRLLGTFTRLSLRDGKHQYLKHRPRVARYLLGNLQHPVLAPLKQWYETNVPDVFKLGSQ